MGRPKVHSQASLMQWGKDFKQKFGLFPARDDLKKPQRDYYINQGFNMLHPTTIERIFGNWSNYRTACGEVQSKYTHSDVAEKSALAYLKTKYNFIENTSYTGHEDGWIGNEGVEVKASILRAKQGNITRFRWMLHYREYSKLVDKVFLIGVDESGTVLVEVLIQGKQDIAAVLDNKQAVELGGESLVKGTSRGILWAYVEAYRPQ